MIDRIWEAFVQSAIALFIPLVCNYFELTNDLFFNGAYEGSQGIEWVADQILTPCHYLFIGQKISKTPDGGWEFTHRFDYTDAFELKTAASCVALLPSFVVGSALKGIALLNPEMRSRIHSIIDAHEGKQLRPLSQLQLDCAKFAIDPELFISKNIARRPGAEHHLSTEKLALSEITTALTKEGISWWVDCGTCLGVYRHGGVIPWDEDLDIAVFQDEFENVRRILNRLDRKKYLVQDWSTREYPHSLIKVFVRETGAMLDIYFFKHDLQKNEVHFIFSFENTLFFPEWWKIRERRYTAPIALNKIFPLKRAIFDGIEVFIPREIEFYLQRYYGENLAPVKIYDPVSNQYIKDLSHPYWQRAYAH